MIAIPWYFAQQNDLIFFGKVYLVTNILSMFWVPISGSIIDKYNRKYVFLFLTFIVGSILSIICYFGFSWGSLPSYMVAAVFVLTFLNYNIHYPCLYAFVQEIIEARSYSRITSLLEIMGQIATILAGAGATLLLEGAPQGAVNIFGASIELGFSFEAWAIQEIFLVDAITYFIAFILIACISYVPTVIRHQESGSLISRLKIGFHYLLGDKPTFWFGVLSYMVFLAVLLEAFYMGVSYVNNHLLESGDVYANSKIAYSLGAIFIGLIIRYLFRTVSLPLVVTVMTFVTAGMFFSLSVTQSVIYFFLMMVVMGITNAGVRIARMTYLFKNVPNQYFGRTASIFFIANATLRISLLFLFTLGFFQIDNNIIFAYGIVSLLLFLTALLMIKHYNSFDQSLSV